MSKYPLRLGESISGNLLYVGPVGDSPGHAVDCQTGRVYYGNPALGMSYEGFDIELPALPTSDSPQRRWRRWAAECRQRIATRNHQQQETNP